MQLLERNTHNTVLVTHEMADHNDRGTMLTEVRSGTHRHQPDYAEDVVMEDSTHKAEERFAAISTLNEFSPQHLDDFSGIQRRGSQYSG